MLRAALYLAQYTFHTIDQLIFMELLVLFKQFIDDPEKYIDTHHFQVDTSHQATRVYLLG
jgi:hypothetical protein